VAIYADFIMAVNNRTKSPVQGKSNRKANPCPGDALWVVFACPSHNGDFGANNQGQTGEIPALSQVANHKLNNWRSLPRR
jgi:hypothetical protein